MIWCDLGKSFYPVVLTLRSPEHLLNQLVTTEVANHLKNYFFSIFRNKKNVLPSSEGRKKKKNFQAAVSSTAVSVVSLARSIYNSNTSLEIHCENRQVRREIWNIFLFGIHSSNGLCLHLLTSFYY